MSLSSPNILQNKEQDETPNLPLYQPTSEVQTSFQNQDSAQKIATYLLSVAICTECLGCFWKWGLTFSFRRMFLQGGSCPGPPALHWVTVGSLRAGCARVAKETALTQSSQRSCFQMPCFLHPRIIES